ncbi:ataxin-7-like protein 3 isoform X1 [Hydractinia symbiolongicarpus]|uniref:ataxin-7-like protein 3 isoform X1 n=1 Tax=Hydractinia symbiolongicarpus TaxID=13093 RepID=UPI00254DF617|nr:ataxin-7-like protein 3 isoform X1 [Hydractinia symbiolongicarpus]
MNPFSFKEMKDICIDDTNEPIVQYMYEIIDICTLGVCFDIHRSIKLGYWDLENIDHESQKEFEIVDQAGLDVFGQQPVKKQQECVCPNCSRTLAANRFAPHLEKCMGMGRNSSRIASKRLQTSGRIEDFDADNDIDYDWSYDYERKSRRTKKDKEKITNSPKRSKLRKAESSIGLSSLINNSNGGSRPGTPCSTASGDIGTSIKAGPTLQALEALSRGMVWNQLKLKIYVNEQLSYCNGILTLCCCCFLFSEEKVALLTQTCGAISEHTGKMCTRTGRCVQHTDEQRKNVRVLLLGDTEDIPWPPSMRPEGSSLDQDDIHVDVDGYEDIDGGSLLRELTPIPWEQESNMSTGSDTMSGPPVPPSPVISKKKKGRKTRSR